MVLHFQIDDYNVSFDSRNVVYVSKQKDIVTIMFNCNKDPLCLALANRDDATDVYNRIVNWLEELK